MKNQSISQSHKICVLRIKKKKAGRNKIKTLKISSFTFFFVAIHCKFNALRASLIMYLFLVVSKYKNIFPFIFEAKWKVLFLFSFVTKQKKKNNNNNKENKMKSSKIKMNMKEKTTEHIFIYHSEITFPDFQNYLRI